MKKILADPGLLAKVVYGSDYPAFVMPVSYLFQTGISGIRFLRQVANPIDKAYYAVKKMGFPDEVFSRSGDILKTE